MAQIDNVDQTRSGKSSRSNPVTIISKHMTKSGPVCEAAIEQMRGFQPKHFSFNVDGGRCDTCKGEGEQW
jgi:excinuclease ABC subunit A